MADPGRNAKTGKPHLVYLSTQAAAMFRELRALAGDSALVMPGRGSTRKPFAKNALNKALEGLTFDMDPLTIHDLRRTGATLLTENGFNRDVIEKALSHEHRASAPSTSSPSSQSSERRCCNGGLITWMGLSTSRR